jgi:hypothetical protein
VAVVVDITLLVAVEQVEFFTQVLKNMLKAHFVQ